MSRKFILITAVFCQFVYLSSNTIKQPNWHHVTISKYIDGFPMKAIYYAPKYGSNYDIPIKEITYYSNGSIKTESDLIAIEKSDPAFTKFQTTVLYHGLAITYFPSGNVLEAKYFDKGRLEGPSKAFYSNGGLQSISNYLNDELHGIKEYYDENGALLEKMTYNHGKLNGEKVTSYPQGQQKSITNYQNGLITKQYVERFENGSLKIKKTFFKGVLNDKDENPAFIQYYPDGSLKEVQHFHFGVREKNHIKYFPDGKKSYVALHLRGEKHSYEKHFFEDGKLKGFGEYRNGIPIGPHYFMQDTKHFASQVTFDSSGSQIEPYIEYDKDGNKILEKKEVINGYYKEWYSNGKIKVEYNYQRGNFDGEQKEYYENEQLSLLTIYDKCQILNRQEWYQNGNLALKETYREGLLDGQRLTYYEDKKVESESFYKLGNLTDTSKTWHRNGELNSIIRYNDNSKPHGKAEKYYPDGQIKESANYIDGKLDGQYLTRFEDGSKKAEKNYSAGNPIGDHIEYHLNGKIAKKAQYVDDLLHGQQSLYYDNGQKLATISYDHGVLHGPRSFWNQSGQIVEDAKYQNGSLEGPYYFKEPNGKEIITNYQNNRLHGQYLIFDLAPDAPQGRLKIIEATYDSGILDGVWNEFNQVGIMICSTYYKQGQKEKISSLYYDDGKVKLTVEYKNNEKNGLAVEYFPNGQIAKQVNFSNNKRHGEEKTFFENGQIKTLYTFKEGQLNGPSFEYNVDGTVVFEAEFLEGLRHGKFNKFDDEGNPRALQVYEHDQLIKKEKLNI